MSRGYIKSQSHANRGKPFEDYLKFVHQVYQNKEIACVHKVPTEFLPIRDAKGRVCSCKVEEKSCVDYLGRYKDIPVAIEAKHTNDKRIDFNRVEDHQADYLDDWSKDPNAVALVLVSFGLCKFYAVPWVFWKAARDSWYWSKGEAITRVTEYGWSWTTPGMASVCQEQLLPDWEIKSGGATGLPYLEIIERMRR